MAPENTPAPSGEYERSHMRTDGMGCIYYPSVRHVIYDLEACERALEAAMAERDALKAENVQLRAVLERNDPVMFKAFQEDDEARHRAIAERDAARAALMDVTQYTKIVNTANGGVALRFEDMDGCAYVQIKSATARELAKAKEAKP